MTKINRLLWGLVLITITFFIVKSLYIKNKIYENLIKGTITEIKYDSKRYQKVRVNGKLYETTLSNEEFNIGDSLYKSKDSYWIKQYRNGTCIREYNWGGR